MKIAYFVNSTNSINWGGQATSNGIAYLIKRQYPNANFVPMDFPKLSKIGIMRQTRDYFLMQAILKNDINKVKKILAKGGIPPDVFKDFTHICFNGEGAIHQKSGHIARLMGLLFLAKHQGLPVAAINQTIDFSNPNSLKAKTLCHVYKSVDFLSVREPVSLEEAYKMGLKKATLIPDAAYGLPKLSKEEIASKCKLLGFKPPYICFAGSSKLKRNGRSIKSVRKVLTWISSEIKLPIVFLANAKTDIWIAKKLQNEFNYTILQPPAIYSDAMAVISQANLLIGGRQHPNIFAYDYKVPYLPFEGNTHKNLGVSKLQNYPIEPLSWDCDKETFINALKLLKETKIDFKPITIDNFDIFGLQKDS
jgi:polysaccharide pyruvyl transferase WcaK-like protein